MDTPPPGYKPPFPVYLVEYMDGTGDKTEGQAGGFTTRVEAEKLQAAS